MTISDLLMSAYHATQFRHPLPIAEAADFPRVELVAKREALSALKDRCHVARVQVAFLDRVLG